MAGKSKPSHSQLRKAHKLLRRHHIDKEKRETIVKVINGDITQAVAGKILGVLPRQIRRLIERYKTGGPEALLHQGRGKPSNHRIDAEMHSQVIEIISAKYSASGPDLISYELENLHDIIVKPETVRRWMLQEGLWIVNDSKRVSVRRWRERKPCYGEMVQMDTSTHNWFGPECGKSYIIAMIDDATSKLFCRFYDSDSTKTNMDLLKRYIQVNGRPVSIYLDRASHFTDNPPKGSQRALGSSETTGTQIQRAMAELDVRMIYAHSPQAKGRVERLFGTLQNRLVGLLRHRDIKTIEEANFFLIKDFLPYWEKKHTSPPMCEQDVHRSVDGYNLDASLSIQTPRVVYNDYTFQFDSCRYQIEPMDMETKMRRNKVVIEERLDGTIKAKFNGKYIHFHIVEVVKK
ncbi:MAG: ISNCY family transposase [Deltaproteobacteria bacterium]|jgi:transposase|nr:ISNCY family transposase [Deltaproteobacteria bacterium]